MSPPGNCAENGTCLLHEQFEEAILRAINSGSENVQKAIESVFRELTRRLDESLADRLALHRRMDEIAQRQATNEANIENIMREGLPLRRAADKGDRPKSDLVPRLPRWVYMGAVPLIMLAGIGILFLAMVMHDPKILMMIFKGPVG